MNKVKFRHGGIDKIWHICYIAMLDLRDGLSRSTNQDLVGLLGWYLKVSNR